MGLFDNEAARSLLDQLFEESRLYTSSKDYLELLKFTKRLRNFAPFNAMLLHVQKPGLTYAASAYDWRTRFERKPKEHARPLLILWPFGPVALVYDVLDTEGKPLPKDVASFFASGSVSDKDIPLFLAKMKAKHISFESFDAGDGRAGSIHRLTVSGDKKPSEYKVYANRNHTAPVRFVTIAHELAHLFLGHLGQDSYLNIPERPRPNHAQAELEAESVAYLVCTRNGVESKSETYLNDYVKANTTVESLDLYQVMRAAGQIETLLGLTAHMDYGPWKRSR
ncbi:MAG: hypothetical protein AMXMBFR84_34190 [Candidatus Hydrogenedentota bacterium]